MVDSFTEMDPDAGGFLQAIGDSIKGVLVGAVILLAGTCCLPWNEYRYVKRMKALEGGLAMTEELPSDKVDASKEGKLVLVSGTAKTAEELSDDTFGIEIPAMQLVREVEMYQYDEDSKKDKKKKTITYSYPEKWSKTKIDSSNFKGEKAKNYRNPAGPMPYTGENWTAESVTLGAFDVPKGYIGSFSLSQKINPGGEATPAASQAPSPAAADPLTCPVCQKKLKSAAGVKDHMKAKHKGEAPAATPASGGGATGAAANPKIPAGYKALDGYLFKGLGTPGSPKIGDVRISWRYAPAQADATIVGKQVGSSFEAFEINDSNVAGIHMGIENKQQYYAKEQASNTMWLYIIRFGGAIMMIVAFGMIFAPLSAVTDMIPIVGDVVDMGTGCAAAGLGAIASFFLIALGWVFARPLIGIPMLLVAIGGLVGLIILAKKMVGDKKPKGMGTPAPAPGFDLGQDAPPPPAPPAPPPAPAA